MVDLPRKRIQKPLNVRGKARIIKIPASDMEQYIVVHPDDRRYMLDLPAGSTVAKAESLDSGSGNVQDTN